LFNELQFNRRGDVSILVRVTEKFSDSSASDLAIIASEFIHVHSDEFAGELRVHIARVCERITDGFVSMCETVIDAFANDLADVASYRKRDIFPHHISA